MIKTRPSIFTILFSVALLIVAIGSFFYMRNIINSALDSTRQDREFVATEEYRKSQGQDTMQILSDSENKRQRVRDLFIKDEDTLKFIEVMEGLGKFASSTVNISSIAADEKGKVGDIGSISMHVEVRGNWQSVMRTVSIAENLPYDVKLSGFRLTSSGLEGGGSKKSWQASFDIKVSTIVGVSSIQ